MATSNYVMVKLQQAVQAYLAAQDASLLSDISESNIFAGLSRSTRSVPCVVCSCQSAVVDEGREFSGNWLATLIVQIRSDADQSTETQHHERAQAILDLMTADAVTGGADYSSITDSLDDFTALFLVPQAQRFGIDGNHWVSELEFRADVCGSDLS